MPSRPTGVRNIAAVALVVTGFATAGVMMAGANSAPDPAFIIETDGQLVRPTDYRQWVYVGTPVTPNDMNNGKAAFPEHHNVYIDPASYEHYKSTGDFRDGTVLIKELVSVGGKQAVSGSGYFQGEFIGLEAAIKSEKHFGTEPGNWAYFSFTNHDELGGDLAAKAAAFPAASCNSCHAASADDDFVFTQYYPVLRAVKNARQNPENRSDRPKTLGMAPAVPNPEASALTNSDGRQPQWRATAPTPADIDDTDVPVSQAALFEYLKSFSYRDWDAQESTTHPSRGPHTKFGNPVRVFMNDTLAASMRDGSNHHPEGSTAIKEMYTPDGELEGWAIEMKTQAASTNGDGWFWYEVTSTTDGSNPIAIGNGIAGCVGCHSSSSRDHVLSTFPLR